MDPKDFYVGSTNKTPASRLTWHLIASYSPAARSLLYAKMQELRSYGGAAANEGWATVVLQDGIELDYLTKHEQAWMDHLKPSLNSARACKADVSGAVVREAIQGAGEKGWVSWTVEVE